MSDITELNVVTGEETTRKFSESEKEMYASLQIDGQEELNVIIEQKRVLLESSIQALKDLGLTEEQARALAGL
jgi:hypothetical protein